MATVKEHKFDKIVAERIATYCKANDISLRKLAKAAGLTNNQIYFITTNRGIISLEQYIKICKALNEPFEFFIRNIKED